MTISDEINLTRKKLNDAYLLFDNATTFSETVDSIFAINELTEYLNNLYQKAKVE